MKNEIQIEEANEKSRHNVWEDETVEREDEEDKFLVN